jgi:hypothetical protein
LALGVLVPSVPEDEHDQQREGRLTESEEDGTEGERIAMGLHVGLLQSIELLNDLPFPAIRGYRLDRVDGFRCVRDSSHGRLLGLSLVSAEADDLHHSNGDEDKERGEADKGNIPRQDEGEDQGAEQAKGKTETSRRSVEAGTMGQT